MHRYKELKFWQLNSAFCKDVYIATNSFPDGEKFGLISQLRRAAISIPSNITEGAAKKSNKDFKRFLRISLGSCYEIETQLLIFCDLNFTNSEEFKVLNNVLD